MEVGGGAGGAEPQLRYSNRGLSTSGRMSHLCVPSLFLSYDSSFLLPACLQLSLWASDLTTLSALWLNGKISPWSLWQLKKEALNILSFRKFDISGV